MGNITSHINESKKSIVNERVILKKIWNGIENNLQYHANIFFLNFCTTYPQYTKYFTFDPDMPLTIDVQTNAKFMIIMDAMSYLLIYFYNKPKQLKFLIGYIAMVHKDMDLMKEDMTNFAESLISYLASSFPDLMSSASEPIVSNYVNKIIDEIAENLENFRNDKLLLSVPFVKQFNYSCIGWRCGGEKLIYGHKLDYWIKRKRMWEERLRDWKLRTRMTIVSSKDSSTGEDEDETPIEEENDDSTIQIVESFQVWEPRKNSRTNKQLMQDDNMRLLLPRRVALKTNRPRQTKYDVEMADLTDEVLVNQELQSSTIETEQLSRSNQPSTSRPFSLSTSLEVDSPARRRRRRLKLAHND
ncbi:uncharacterized protein [Chelonus insularis]|uniref:uncharacterized protein n=1 Tax=Chelonus insularis TaxID=460826 RepID=UPI00158D0B79|nr:uncharacterized protein LOC118072610 [Chelonus insularis]